MLIHALLSFLLLIHGFILIRFGLFEFLLFLFYEQEISKLLLLNFCCQNISFLCKHNFFIDEKHMQWNLDTKVKLFHESMSYFMKCPWNCISWNGLKERFHGVSLPLGKGVLKICSKFTGEYPCQSVILIKLCRGMSLIIIMEKPQFLLFLFQQTMKISRIRE